MGQAVINRPPSRSARPLVALWLVAAAGLGLLLALARVAEGPLDDSDPAWQRPGFLDAGDLPLPAPQVAPGFPAPGRPAVVFFERAGRLRELCQALGASSLGRTAATAVVVAERASGSCDEAGTVVGDPAAEIARAYGLRHPRGGGPPVGYAVVDAAGAIRYRTLDPAVADEFSEVATIVAALP